MPMPPDDYNLRIWLLERICTPSDRAHMAQRAIDETIYTCVWFVNGQREFERAASAVDLVCAFMFRMAALDWPAADVKSKFSRRATAFCSTAKDA